MYIKLNGETAGPSPFLFCKDKDIFWGFAVLEMFCIRLEPFPLPFHVWIKTLTVQQEQCVSERRAICLTLKQHSLHGLIQLRMSHWTVLVPPHFSKTPAAEQTQVCHSHFAPALPSPFQLRLATLFTEVDTNICRKQRLWRQELRPP